MSIEIRQKFHQLPAKRTIDIIRRASGRPHYEVEKFIKDLDTHESRKINVSLKKSVLTRREIKKLINDSAKNGLNINRDRLWSEFEKVDKEEKKRRVQYGKIRSEVSQRMERITGRGSASALMGDTSDKTDALINRLHSTGQEEKGSGKPTSGWDPEENNNNTPPPPKVIDLPIG